MAELTDLTPPTAAASCCSTETQATCCEPADKAACCETSAVGG
jgi:arsenite methyltransferase